MIFPEDIGIVILAGGSSSRMGQPKQTLPLGEHTLVARAVQTAQDAGANHIMLVTGAASETVAAAVPASGVSIVRNDEWAEGLASSIRAGLAHAESIQRFRALLWMVCDQPFVTPQLLQELVARYEKGMHQVVACSYAATVGTPVLFDAALFPELAALQGDTGAKKLVLAHQDTTALVPFAMGSIDIDTPSDYQALLQRGNNG